MLLVQDEKMEETDFGAFSLSWAKTGSGLLADFLKIWLSEWLSHHVINNCSTRKRVKLIVVLRMCNR
jgi:hypothetical protein